MHDSKVSKFHNILFSLSSLRKSLKNIRSLLFQSHTRKYYVSKMFLNFEFLLPEAFSYRMHRRMEKNSFFLDKPKIGKNYTNKFSGSKDISKLKSDRAAVICWDLGNNPAGRALVLAEILKTKYKQVDIIGPVYPDADGELWKPISSLNNFRVIYREVSSFSDLQDFAGTLEGLDYDFIYMCKPRYPTVYLGLYLSSISRCKFAIDIDDYELSFFSKKKIDSLLEKTSRKIYSDELSITGFEATNLVHSILKKFPATTVSNPALKRLFNGTIINHARDERVFDPKRYDRRKIRSSFGYQDTDKVIVFIGTIRKHKGILDIIEAVEKLADRNIKLCVVGPVKQKDILKRIKSYCKTFVQHIEGVPFEKLPETVSMADLVCLPQSPNNEISKYQIPAKLSDALAMGIPVLVEDLEPFSEIKKMKGVFIRGKQPLGKAIKNLLYNINIDRDEIRRSFLEHLSLTENARRFFEFLGKTDKPDISDQKELTNSIIYNWKADREKIEKRLSYSNIITGKKPDIVFLWKQNDGGLFGRRSDMITKYTRMMGSFGKVMHFDSSISLTQIQKMEEESVSSPLSAAKLVRNNIIARNQGVYDRFHEAFFTFIYDEKRRSFGNVELPTKEDYRELLYQKFREFNLSQDTVLWMWPVVEDIDDFLAAHNFTHVVSDIVDDQREFNKRGNGWERLTASYKYSFSQSHTLFTNCEHNREVFKKLTDKEIHIVPNTSERTPRSMIHSIQLYPDDNVFRIGYAGNLRDRIDIELLLKIADFSPNWRVILVGPTGRNAEVEALARHPNIKLVGPQVYEDTCSLIAGFDVAIIPHIKNSLTDSMNPLKLYVYQQLGVPVVTSAVNNLTNISHGVSIAGNHNDFIDELQNIEQAVGSIKENRLPDHSLEFNWEMAVENMLELVLNKI